MSRVGILWLSSAKFGLDILDSEGSAFNSLILSPTHLPDITEILLKGRKIALSNDCFHSQKLRLDTHNYLFICLFSRLPQALGAI